MINVHKDQSNKAVRIIDLEKVTSPSENVHLIYPTEDIPQYKIHQNGCLTPIQISPEQHRKSMFYYHANEKNPKDDFDTIPKRQEHRKRSTLMARTIDEFQMSKFLKQLRPTISTQGLDSATKVTPVLRQLKSIRSKLSEEARYKKAARHFRDAMYLRSVRHDIDNTNSKFLRGAYFLQTSPKWEMLLYLLSWLYMVVGFLEAPHAKSIDFFKKHPENLSIAFWIEVLILSFFAIELFIEIYHRSHDTKPFREKFIHNKKFIFKIMLDIIFFLDFAFFYSYIPRMSLRFSRSLRPFCLVLYSYQLRKTFYGIIKSMREMLNIIVLLLVIACLFALLGMSIIGDLDEEITFDKYISNFSEFGPAMNGFFVLFSLDNYPEIMIPALKSSQLYLLFFIPFVAINILLLIPIPIAVIFDAFRKHRSNLVVKERIKEREALVACFLTLDINEYALFSLRVKIIRNKALGKDEIISLCKFLYPKRLNITKLYEIYDFAEKDRHNRIVLSTFFELAEIIESSKHLVLQKALYIKLWEQFLTKINKVLKFDKISRHYSFELIINACILFNTGTYYVKVFDEFIVILTIYICRKNSDDQLFLLNFIDTIFTFIYMAELVIKLFGLGFRRYFSDPWNILDFIFNVISISTYSIVGSEMFTNTSKSSLIFRLSRGPRVFKILRTLKSFRLFGSFAKFSDFDRTLRLFENILLCLPIVFKLAVVLIMTIYFFAIIGMEIFPSEYMIEKESPYVEERYTDFDSLGGSFLQLFQIITETTWALILFDYAWRYDSLLKASLYFNSFRVIANLIILSLLTGLIWEVFAYMEKYREQQLKLNHELDRHMRTKLVHDPQIQPSENSPRLERTYIESQMSEEPSLSVTPPSRRQIKSKSGIEIKPSQQKVKKQEKAYDSNRNALLSEEDQNFITEPSPTIHPDEAQKENGSTNTFSSLDNLALRTMKSSSRNQLLSIHENLSYDNKDDDGRNHNLSEHKRPGIDLIASPSSPNNNWRFIDENEENREQIKESTSQIDQSKLENRPIKSKYSFNLKLKSLCKNNTSNNEDELESQTSEQEDEIIETIPFEGCSARSETSEKNRKETTNPEDISLRLSTMNNNILGGIRRNSQKRVSWKKDMNPVIINQVDMNASLERNNSATPKGQMEASGQGKSLVLKNFIKLPSFGREDISLDSKPLNKLQKSRSTSPKFMSTSKKRQDQQIEKKRSFREALESFVLGSNRDKSQNDSKQLDNEKNLSPGSEKAINRFSLINREDGKRDSLSDAKSPLTPQERSIMIRNLNFPILTCKKSTPNSARRNRHSLQIAASVLENSKPADLSISKSSTHSESDNPALVDQVRLEREFYTRKIRICQHIARFSNQLDYVFDPSQKSKFTHDVLILRLEELEGDDNQESLSYNDDRSSEQYASPVQAQELERRKMWLRTHLRGDKILRKALLKGTNRDAVQQYEDQHFKKVYGKWFEYLHNPKIERVLDIFKTENNILIRMMRLLRQQDVASSDFVELTYMIENSINLNLLQKGGMGKFIFKDSKNKWFILFKEKQKFKIQYLGAGFWDHFNDIFTDSTKLYEGQDILFPGAKSKYEDIVQTFHKSLKRASKRIPNNTFAHLHRNDHIWNMYAIPLEASSVKNVRTNVLKAAKTDLKTNIKMADKCLVTKGVFLSVNFIMKAKKPPRSDKNPRRMLHSSFLRGNHFIKRKVSADFANLKPADRKTRRNGVSFGRPLRGKSLNDDENNESIEDRFFADEEHEEKKQTKISSSDEFLPLQEYVDFLMDIRDATNIYKDHLLAKLSHFYLSLDSDKV